MKSVSFRKSVVFFLAAALALGSLSAAFAGGSKEAAKESAGAKAEPTVLKLGSTITTTHPHMVAARKAGEWIKERTKGQIELQVFPDGQLGKEGDIFEGVMMGSIQMYLVAPAMVAKYYPAMAISDMAYMWKDYESHKKVMRGPIGQEFVQGILAKTNTRVLDFHWDYGARQVTANVPATKPSDLKGLKIRCPESPVNVAIGHAIGYTPTPMDPQEVYTAIQQKVVDGQENPIPTIYARKFYEVNTNIILTEHIHQFEVVGINEKLFSGFSREIQDIIRTAIIEGGDLAGKLNRENEEKQLKEMEAKGMKVSRPDLDAFRAACSQIYKQFESKWGVGLYEKILAAQK
jgi:tripartite ATP-independent transporter DctP family solute receptor